MVNDMPRGSYKSPIILDPRLIKAMRKLKGPYETWNGFFARRLEITREELGIPEGEHWGNPKPDEDGLT